MMRMLGTTRGKLVLLLRRANRTVNELAASLGLTDNAVRAHLATLERDGLVRPAGQQAGARRPHTSYALTADAEHLFPKAYGAVLGAVLDVLGERLPPDQVRELLRETGKRLGRSLALPGGSHDRKTRLRHVLTVLEEIGGLAELEETEGKTVIRGYSCPLADAVRQHPEACELAESLVSELAGEPVVECCNKEGTPRCRFEVCTRQ